MREIKFRAWVKKEKILVPCSGPWMGGVMAIVEGGPSPLTFMAYGEDSVEVTQYTGLKDKNGKEIYEGDIVRFEGKCHEVVWDDAFVLKGEVVGAYYFDEYMVAGVAHNERGNLEVIGNIHENPDLIPKGGNYEN